MNSDYLKDLGVKTLILLFGLVVILVDLPILAASDTNTSLTDGFITGNEITISQTEAGNSSRVPQLRLQHILWLLSDIIR